MSFTAGAPGRWRRVVRVVTITTFDACPDWLVVDEPSTGRPAG
jgi:hypothetical protein